MNQVIIGIGSNIDADANIQKMLVLLKRKVKIVKLSELVITKPIGIVDQPNFTNGAVKILTGLSIIKLTKELKVIEDQLGRDRSGEKFGPRTIDLDIVIWNGEVIDDDYYTRDFLKVAVDEVK